MAKRQQEQQQLVISNVSLPAGFKVVKQITLPSLAIKKAGDSKILKIMDAMRISKVVDKSAEGKKREPATICTVTDMETGELFTFIVPAVVKKNLQETYENDSYVDRIFQITNKGKRNEAQKYYDFQLLEVSED